MRSNLQMEEEDVDSTESTGRSSSDEEEVDDDDDDADIPISKLIEDKLVNKKKEFQPRRVAEVSADSPGFTRPPSYRGNPHSENYYQIKYVRSWQQKALRRGLVADAIFANAIMIRTGFPNAGMLTMGTCVFEDIGLGCPDAGAYAIEQYCKYKKVLSEAKKAMTEDKKWSPSQAVTCKAAVTVYMQTLLVLLSVPKSRIVACVSPLSIKYTDELLLRKEGGEMVRNKQQYSPKEVLSTWLDAVQEAALDRSRDEQKRQRALAWTNVVYQLSTYDAAPQFAAEFRKKLQTQLSQRAINKKLFAHKDDQETVRSILKCKGGRKFGSERLRLFQAVMIIIMPELCCNSKQHSAYKYAEKVDKKELARCVDMCMKPLGRDLAIPDYVFDKHTAVGKAGDDRTDEYYAEMLFKQAEKWGELDMVKSWSQAEIRKSHRAVATLTASAASDNKDDDAMKDDDEGGGGGGDKKKEKKEKKKDPMGHFFDYGAVIGPPEKVWKNPYHDPCRAFYIDYCDKNGGDFSRTKTKYMAAKQWARLAERIQLPPIEEPKKRKQKKRKREEMEVDEKKTTKSKKRKITPKETSAAMETNGDGDASAKEEGEEEEDEEEEEDDDEKKTVKKKKQQRQTKKPSERKDEIPCNRDLPVGFPKELSMKKENILTADEVKRIRRLPWAQMVTGKGSFLSGWMNKKTMHMEERWCWRGAYVLDKKGKVGDKLKVQLMVWRTALAKRMGVNVATFELFAEEDHPNRIWLRFEQLSPVPRSEWKITSRVHKETLNALEKEEKKTKKKKEKKNNDRDLLVKAATVQIVDRASCGVVDCYHVDSSLWQQQPELLVEMMQCNMFKFVCQPPCGDIHLGNLLLVGQKKVFAVDLEDFRTNCPDYSPDKPIRPWWHYAFNRNLRSSEFREPIQKAIAAHRPKIVAGLQACLQRVQDEISADQIQRARVFIKSIESV